MTNPTQTPVGARQTSVAPHEAPQSAMTGSRANPIKAQPGDKNPPLSAQDARQGRGGTRLLTILAVSILLAIGAFVLVGMFGQDLLTADVGPLPGPSDAQEQLITQ